MSDKELAEKIVFYFKSSENYFFNKRDRTFKNLLNTTLIDAFNWSMTREGTNFWCHLYRERFPNNKTFKRFLIKNLKDISTFINLKVFI